MNAESKMLEGANELLGIEPVAFSSGLCVTICGTYSVLVQNFDRVCEYTGSCASFTAKNVLCEICGEDLCLIGLAADTVRVTGKIFSVTFTEAEK